MDNYGTTNLDDQPGLTLEALLETYERLQALLPVVQYKTSKYLEATRNGEPLFYSVPISVVSTDMLDFEMPKMDGQKLLMFHPDNLAYAQDRARGNCILVEWTS